MSNSGADTELRTEAELEQFTLADKIKGSVRSSVSAPEFDKKHLKKAEGRIGQNVGFGGCSSFPDRTQQKKKKKITGELGPGNFIIAAAPPEFY